MNTVVSKSTQFSEIWCSFSCFIRVVSSWRRWEIDGGQEEKEVVEDFLDQNLERIVLDTTLAA